MIAILEGNNIKKDRIIFDPGIGFGKNADQSFKLIENIYKFKNLDVPIFVGHSRKSFMKSILNNTTDKRDVETAIISSYLANHGVEYLRVHNVTATVNALKINEILQLG